MADYNAILDTQIEPDAPITAQLGGQWRDNPIAIAEGAPDAPVVATGWHPYNLTTVGGAQTGLFYDNAVDGNTTTIDTPDFEDGYEYAVRMENFGATGTATITVAAFRETSGSLSAAVSLITGNSLLWGVLEVPMARVNKTGQGVFSSTGLYRNAGIETDFIGALGIPYGVSTAQKTTRIRFAGATFNSGRLYLLRRREYVSG
jgi:hypothetical protein